MFQEEAMRMQVQVDQALSKTVREGISHIKAVQEQVHS